MRRNLVPFVASLPMLLAVVAAPAAGQSGAPPPDRADVASVDAILEAVYAAISGPAGQPRDWDRFRSLFVPDARLIPTGSSADGVYRHRSWTPEEYIEAAGRSLERDGFFEREIHRVEERYGPVVHAFSTYESRRRADADPFTRGINSFQLFWDGSRWWVVSIFWHGESAASPIPPAYLPPGG